MFVSVIFLILICAFIVLLQYIFNTIHIYQPTVVEPKIKLFQNLETDVVVLPETAIDLEENPTQCHTVLTPCENTGDCFQCREMLATCHEFVEPVTIEINNTEVSIEPGEKYCLAIDQTRSRTCNVYTGKWILVQTDTGYGLICKCRYPGLVTQTNIFSDCNISVGCNGVGTIEDMNVSPLKCTCNNGYVSDFDSLKQPYCRPRQIRDAVYDSNIFPRVPCPNNFIPVNHPGLDDEYQKLFINRDICVRDPCTVDPVTQLTVSGALHYDDDRGAFCNCNARNGVYGVWSTESMLKINPLRIANACISPTHSRNSDNKNHQYYLKWFWARDEIRLISDMEAVIRTTREFIHPQYQVLMHNYAENRWTIKFAVFETYWPMFDGVKFDNHYTRLIRHQGTTSQPNCLQHSVRACAEDICVWHDPRTALVSTKEFFTGKKCQLSRVNARDYKRDWIIAYASPSHYGRGFPCVFYIVNHYHRDLLSTDDTQIYPVAADWVTQNTKELGDFLKTYMYYSRT